MCWSHLERHFTVTLRNVSLQSRLGMSVCGHAQELGCHRYVHYTRTSMEDRVWGGQHFLVMEDGKDSEAWPWQHAYLAESSAELSTECC